MLYGLIADIHANFLAFEACLEQCARLGVTRQAILGDLVGYGADPELVVQRVIRLSQQGAVVLKGNHDAAIDDDLANMNPVALAAIRWTKTQLSDEAKSFLRQLPLVQDDGDLLFVHAEASAPERFRYVTDAETAQRSLVAVKSRITFCGHVHVPQLYCMSASEKMVRHSPITNVPVPLSPVRQWLAVLGACGQPRDGNPAAAFATFDTVTRDLTFRRASYDVETAADRIRAAGLPERLASRLLAGE